MMTVWLEIYPYVYNQFVHKEKTALETFFVLYGSTDEKKNAAVQASYHLYIFINIYTYSIYFAHICSLTHKISYELACNLFWSIIEKNARTHTHTQHTGAKECLMVGGGD